MPINSVAFIVFTHFATSWLICQPSPCARVIPDIGTITAIYENFTPRICRIEIVDISMLDHISAEVMRILVLDQFEGSNSLGFGVFLGSNDFEKISFYSISLDSMSTKWISH